MGVQHQRLRAARRARAPAAADPPDLRGRRVRRLLVLPAAVTTSIPHAVPVPYVHSNVMSDEVIYYASSEFMSRKGIEYGSITLHPDGVPHGPHPGRTEASLGAKRDQRAGGDARHVPPAPGGEGGRSTSKTRDYYRSWVEPARAGPLDDRPHAQSGRGELGGFRVRRPAPTSRSRTCRSACSRGAAARDAPRVGVAIGDLILDVGACANAGLFAGAAADPAPRLRGAVAQRADGPGPRQLDRAAPRAVRSCSTPTRRAPTRSRTASRRSWCRRPTRRCSCRPRSATTPTSTPRCIHATNVGA